MSFKHRDFPEQAVVGLYVESDKGAARPVKVLNLFGYTGGATVAAAAGGEVTHWIRPKAWFTPPVKTLSSPDSKRRNQMDR